MNTYQFFVSTLILVGLLFMWFIRILPTASLIHFWLLISVPPEKLKYELLKSSQTPPAKLSKSCRKPSRLRLLKLHSVSRQRINSSWPLPNSSRKVSNSRGSYLKKRCGCRYPSVSSTQLWRVVNSHRKDLWNDINNNQWLCRNLSGVKFHKYFAITRVYLSSLISMWIAAAFAKPPWTVKQM